MQNSDTMLLNQEDTLVIRLVPSVEMAVFTNEGADRRRKDCCIAWSFQKDNIMNDDQKETITQFRDAVNMSAKELAEWLNTDESKAVGQKDGGGESTGHKMGGTIVELLGKKQSDYTDDDVHEMSRVVSYVHRHLAQRPDDDIENTRWRYSLMNWGHDPLKQ